MLQRNITPQSNIKFNWTKPFFCQLRVFKPKGPMVMCVNTCNLIHECIAITRLERHEQSSPVSLIDMGIDGETVIFYIAEFEGQHQSFRKWCNKYSFIYDMRLYKHFKVFSDAAERKMVQDVERRADTLPEIMVHTQARRTLGGMADSS